MSGTTVGVGIIGGGLMGREVAAAIERWPALVDHPVRPRLVAVCDVNPAALAWFDQIDSVELTTGDHRALLADDRVDVVYVAVRHDLHESLYRDVIRAGKSLLAEKPFGIDEAAARAICDEAEAHPESFVRCSSEMPYFPGAQRAIDLVRSGALGRMIGARSAFLHSSDLDLDKPSNWKRQAALCGAAGVMNDLGMHTWHVPLRLGWRPDSVYGMLQDLVQERPGPDGTPVPCDTWDNAVLHCWSSHEGERFPLTVETKRIEPGAKNTWVFEAVGMDGGVRFSTADPAAIHVFSMVDVPGLGREQSWARVEVGSRSAWPTVTGANFEFGFSDAILQMWALYLAERAGALGDRFGTVRPEEALATHGIFRAAMESDREARAVSP